jgi:hypothetical protein
VGFFLQSFYPPEILIRVEEDYGRNLLLGLYNSDQQQHKPFHLTNEIRIENPYTQLRDHKFFLSIKNPFKEPLCYKLEISYRSMGTFAGFLNTWSAYLDWEDILKYIEGYRAIWINKQQLLGDPENIIRRYIYGTYHHWKDETVKKLEEGQLQYLFGKIAYETERLDDAEHLLGKSYIAFNDLGDTENEILVLENLKDLCLTRGNMKKFSEFSDKLKLIKG